MQIAIVLLAVVACVIATPAQSYDYKPSYPSYSGYKDNYDYAPAYYDFGYKVKDDYSYVDFGHNENRNGDKTNGQYNVVLPDGRRQIVNYYVDGYSGYVADVKYEGGYKPAYADYKPTYSADYKPDYKPAYKPVYPQTEYKPAYKPSYSSAYAPAYKPAY